MSTGEEASHAGQTAPSEQTPKQTPTPDKRFEGLLYRDNILRSDAEIGDNTGSLHITDGPSEEEIWENHATYVADDVGEGRTEKKST